MSEGGYREQVLGREMVRTLVTNSQKEKAGRTDSEALVPCIRGKRAQDGGQVWRRCSVTHGECSKGSCRNPTSGDPSSRALGEQ